MKQVRQPVGDVLVKTLFFVLSSWRRSSSKGSFWSVSCSPHIQVYEENFKVYVLSGDSCEGLPHGKSFCFPRHWLLKHVDSSKCRSPKLDECVFRLNGLLQACHKRKFVIVGLGIPWPCALALEIVVHYWGSVVPAERGCWMVRGPDTGSKERLLSRTGVPGSESFMGDGSSLERDFEDTSVLVYTDGKDSDNLDLSTGLTRKTYLVGNQ